MRRLILLIGFVALIAVDTIVQIGFKMAGRNTLPVTLDLPWLTRVVNEPWVIVVVLGYLAAFFLYMTILKHAPVGPAFAASHLEIVAVTVFSVWYFGDRISWLQSVGCVAIVAGVIVLAVYEQEE